MVVQEVLWANYFAGSVLASCARPASQSSSPSALPAQYL